MKLFIIFTSTFFLLLFSMNVGKVYSADATPSSDNHTARAAISEGEPRLDHTRREETEGKAIWERLQAKQLECKNITDNNFESLGEYFMGQMLAPSGAEGAGSSHEAMNNMMVRMMGKVGEEQMHVVIGKRLSGCDTKAPFSLGVISILTWIVLLVFLILGSAYFLFEIQRKK